MSSSLPIRHLKSLCWPGGRQGGTLDPQRCPATICHQPSPTSAGDCSTQTSFASPLPDQPTPTYNNYIQPPCFLSFRILYLLFLLLLPPVSNAWQNAYKNQVRASQVIYLEELAATATRCTIRKWQTNSQEIKSIKKYRYIWFGEKLVLMLTNWCVYWVHSQKSSSNSASIH